MKKLLTVFALCLLNIMPLLGSHLKSMTLTHECVGNNQYKFKLYQITECAGPPQIGTATLFGPQSVTLNLVEQKIISRDCKNQPAICDSNNVPWVYRVNIYESQPVTLVSAPPAAGATFTFNLCCRPTNVVNVQANSQYFISTTIYPSNGGCYSGGQYDENYLQTIYAGQNSIQLGLAAGQAGDSLHHELIAPLTSNGVTVTYDTGYSATSPLPNTLTHPGNGYNIFNSRSGELSYDIQNASFGLYTIGVKTEVWRNQTLVASSSREVITYPVINSTSSNAAPTVAASSQNNINLDTVTVDHFRAEVYPGDTLSIQVVATDLDTHSSGSFQKVSFVGSGMALDSGFYGSQAHFNQMASFTPSFGQSGFSNNINNSVDFHWAIAPEHHAGGVARYFFKMDFYDDYCPNASTISILEVVVRPSLNILRDSVTVCAGDSIQLQGAVRSGNYSWSPASGLSDPAIASPMASPATSGYYYLTDPSNPQYKDSVFVSIETRQTFSLSYNGSQLKLLDSVRSGNLVWYYNGVPFAHPYRTLTPFAAGDYYVYTNSASCRYYSDTVTVAGPVFATTGIGNSGNLAPEAMPILRTLAFDFELSGGVTSANLGSLFLPGLEDRAGKAGGDQLLAVLYDQQGTEIWRHDTVVTGFHGGIFDLQVGVNLQGQQQYTLSLRGDSGFVMPYFENVTAPYTVQNGEMTVTAINSGSGNGVPATPSDTILGVALNLDNMVSVAANDLLAGIDIYPNPAADYILMRGYAEGANFRLYDLQGRLLRVGELKGSSFRLNRRALPDGVYQLEIISGSQRVRSQVIFR